MNAGTKKPVGIAPPADVVLSAAEQRLLAAFRKMDDMRKGHLLLICDGLADGFPRSTRGALRLIAGGAQ